MNPFSLEGQTALITGGGTGLGFGIATSFVPVSYTHLDVYKRQGQQRCQQQPEPPGWAWGSHRHRSALLGRAARWRGQVCIVGGSAGGINGPEKRGENRAIWYCLEILLQAVSYTHLDVYKRQELTIMNNALRMLLAAMMRARWVGRLRIWISAYIGTL